MSSIMKDDSSSKEISRFSLTTLIVASMIGAGVFTTSGYAIADLRDPWLVMLAWLIGGIIAICGAISYGQLATRLTENGGEYLFLSKFAHPFFGFLAGWISLFAGFTGAGAYAASAFESYASLDAVKPGWIPDGAIGILLVVIATLAHAINTRKGAAGQSSVVVLKLGLLVLFIAWSFLSMKSWVGGEPIAISDDETPNVSFLIFATSLTWISLSYCGFNAAVYVAGEAKNGSKDVSFAMLVGTIIVMFLYLCLNSIFLFAPEAASIAGRQDIGSIAASVIGGETLSKIVRITICLGLASSVSSTIMAGPRVYAKMAEDGVFPKFFASKVSPPFRSVILQGVAISIVLCFTTLQNLLSYLGMTLSLSSAFTVSTLLFRTGNRTDYQSNWSSKIAPSLYVFSTLVLSFLTAWRQPLEAIAVIVTLASGGLAYWMIQRFNENKVVQSS